LKLAVRGAAVSNGLGGMRSCQQRRSCRPEEGRQLGSGALLVSVENEMEEMDLGRLTPIGLGPYAGRGGEFSERGDLGQGS
jgi:hypothetical protein